MTDKERWLKNMALYKRLVKRFSFEEKCWLLECKGDYDIYEVRLKFLAKKYGIDPDKA